ncbi:MAG: hypothetical protein K8S98_02835 [Planctomycetes bacterium]|nr:hypothetical protein [Planctomycetota bacterium]
MVASQPDVLELLLPNAPPSVVRRAVALTTFARLLVSDAQDVRSPSITVTLDHATREFERDGRERAHAVLRELLRAHLASSLRASSFLWVGEVRESVPTLWRRWLDGARDLAQTVHVPLPDEDALSVADRLLDGAATLGFPDDELALWRARRRYAADGARAVEAELEQAFADAPTARRATWLAHRIECALERGAVRRARSWLDEHAALVAADERLVHLDAWTRLALGERPTRAAAWHGVLPRALCEWREASDAARPFLTGKASTRSDRGAATAASRRDVGASVLVVLAATHASGARIVFHDVAAALRPKFQAWLASRADALVAGGSPEQRLVATAERITARRSDVGPLSDALDPQGCEVLILEPVRDRRGEIAGWLWLEFEHRLAPSSADLERAAAHWTVPVLDAVDERPRTETPERGVAAEPARAERLLVRAFESLVDALAMKTAQRRWWGFVLDAAGARAVAEGGAAFEAPPNTSPRSPERARIVERVSRARGRVRFDELAPDFSIHPASASGAAFAIELGGRVRGVLAIESLRRRDFRDSDLERWGACATARAADLVVAAFRAWHRSRHAVDVWLGEGARLCERLAEIDLAAGCRAPVVLVGARGTGKRVVARWLHFEGRGATAPCVEVAGHETDSAREDEPSLRSRRGLDALLARSRGGMLVIARPDGLAPTLQDELARALARANDDDAARIVVTLLEPASQLADRGHLTPELARRLAHLELAVPALSARRSLVPGLVDVLLERFAEREHRAPPRLDDGALACLWRREWRRNVHELAAVAYRLVVAHSGRDVDAATLTVELERMGLDAPVKLPSRRLEPSWITEALETTRHQSGGVNKTRAAAFLGWDPDTLVARMREAGLDLSAGAPDSKSADSNS